MQLREALMKTQAFKAANTSSGTRCSALALLGHSWAAKAYARTSHRGMVWLKLDLFASVQQRHL